MLNSHCNNNVKKIKNKKKEKILSELDENPYCSNGYMDLQPPYLLLSYGVFSAYNQ